MQKKITNYPNYNVQHTREIVCERFSGKLHIIKEDILWKISYTLEDSSKIYTENIEFRPVWETIIDEIEDYSYINKYCDYLLTSKWKLIQLPYKEWLYYNNLMNHNNDNNDYNDWISTHKEEN